jgi:hypothetical protein
VSDDGVDLEPTGVEPLDTGPASAPRASGPAGITALPEEPTDDPEEPTDDEGAPTTVRRRAAQLAQRMPLVHFPAGTQIRVWSREWSDLSSRAARGEPVEPGHFGALRGNHVFTYAGPSCYYRRDCVGDALVYFDPTACDERSGGASPFDSGSLEDPEPRLQPWAARSVAERWAFLSEKTVPLGGFRERFAEWLAYVYLEDPDRYLDTTPDRHTAGEPDRLSPQELLQHNGRLGRERYGAGACGDRRTWTWEVRIAWALPFEKVRLLHVPFDQLELASRLADSMQWSTGFIPDVETLPPELPADFDTLYQDSGRVLRRIVG